jgi:membrane protease YdiL (CAAX protease family)
MKQFLLSVMGKTQPVTWGLMQVVWLILGFVLMQVAGAAGCVALSSGLLTLIAAVTQQPPGAAQHSVLAAALAGYLTATLWSLWYIGRLGEARVADGSPQGIGWKPASSQAYFMATLCALVIVALVFGIVHVFPPDLKALRDLPSAKLFDTSGISAALLFALVVFVAPPVEEFVFRGGVFSALASRFSPLWAGIITTALFMAVHAPEKIHYPAGFIDVGLMAAAAAWLRVRYNSIKPGILLHVLYNAGLMLAAGVAS